MKHQTKKAHGRITALSLFLCLAILLLASCSESTKKDETTAVRIANVSQRLSSDTGE